MLKIDSSSFDQAAFAQLGEALGSRQQGSPYVVVEDARIEQAPRRTVRRPAATVPDPGGILRLTGGNGPA